MHFAFCCLMAEAARCYSYPWELSRVPIPMEVLLMDPVLHYVHCRDEMVSYLTVCIRSEMS